jgi:hypothetical protein
VFLEGHLLLSERCSMPLSVLRVGEDKPGNVSDIEGPPYLPRG